MINLIPPAAKTQIVHEYRMRVSIVVMMLLIIATGITALLQVPSYILLSSQLQAYEMEFQAAKLQQDDLVKVEETVKTTNTLARHVATSNRSPYFSDIVTTLEGIAGSQVKILQFQSTRASSTVESVQIRGVAATRSALAAFSNNVGEHPMFRDANVPISNLAKDKDIDFEITVTLEPQQ